jgi:hypothetical protein
MFEFKLIHNLKYQITITLSPHSIINELVTQIPITTWNQLRSKLKLKVITSCLSTCYQRILHLKVTQSSVNISS